MDFKDSQTKKNLARAFVGECTDGARYQFMSKDAKAKGYGFIANTLKVLAKNEMAHARVFYDLILCQGVRDCECKCGECNIDVCAGYPFSNYILPESLKSASMVEKHESSEVYKEFEATAIEEGYPDVAKAFHHVVQVENCHYLQLKELYDKSKANKLYKIKDGNKWKCSNCGVEIEDKCAPLVCPLCNYDQGYYMVPLSDEEE